MNVQAISTKEAVQATAIDAIMADLKAAQTFYSPVMCAWVNMSACDLELDRALETAYQSAIQATKRQ